MESPVVVGGPRAGTLRYGSQLPACATGGRGSDGVSSVVVCPQGALRSASPVCSYGAVVSASPGRQVVRRRVAATISAHAQVDSSSRVAYRSPDRYAVSAGVNGLLHHGQVLSTAWSPSGEAAVSVPVIPLRVASVHAHETRKAQAVPGSGELASPGGGGFLPSLKAFFGFGSKATEAASLAESQAPAEVSSGMASQVLRVGGTYQIIAAPRTTHQFVVVRRASQKPAQHANVLPASQRPLLISGQTGRSVEREGLPASAHRAATPEAPRWVDASGRVWMGANPRRETPRQPVRVHGTPAKNAQIFHRRVASSSRGNATAFVPVAALPSLVPSGGVSTPGTPRDGARARGVVSGVRSPTASPSPAPSLHVQRAKKDGVAAVRRQATSAGVGPQHGAGYHAPRQNARADAAPSAGTTAKASKAEGLPESAEETGSRPPSGAEDKVLMEFGQAHPDGVLKGCKKIVETTDEGQAVEERLVQKLMIHDNPDVFVMPNLVSPNACERLIAYCEGRWEPSKTSRGKADAVPDAYSTSTSLTRTSMSVRLRPAETPEVQRLESIVAAFAEMPVSHLEPLVVVKYEEGEFFSEHHDGQFRPVTMLLYLNDVAEGGETEFSNMGLKITPTQGCGLMWRNVCGPNNQIDPRVLHAALPPLKGQKYVVNCFFNQRPLRNSMLPNRAAAAGVGGAPLANRYATATAATQSQPTSPRAVGGAAAYRPTPPQLPSSVGGSRTHDAVAERGVAASRPRAASPGLPSSAARASFPVSAISQAAGLPSGGCQGVFLQGRGALPAPGAAVQRAPGRAATSVPFQGYAGRQGGAMGQTAAPAPFGAAPVAAAAAHTPFLNMAGLSLPAAGFAQTGGNPGANFFSSAPAFMMVFGPDGVPQLKPLTQDQVDDGVGKHLIMEAMRNMAPPGQPRGQRRST
ncbi:oxidoreductase, 2OG-Fe(II) oxygenase family protein [Besnoitia besnoiti]|uniref:Oxidoreductase, 2OG-Fe(II) oxygenase family protein n=1 Tax=Besnoitia besnoiti TaxID=94643 RepID=A0A2A9M091_BESBE|nr:oxidoreductase, 2OG-Fe(II) oxygenase family protein [Besnoitia besnoiti]PFH32018.1 oxidoreductase, 2OG-Fe(II) oxygenase family protein [Besnoitia besnoiti]